MLTQSEVSRINRVLEQAVLNNCRSCALSFRRDQSDTDNEPGSGVLVRWDTTVPDAQIEIVEIDRNGLVVERREFGNMDAVTEHYSKEA